MLAELVKDGVSFFERTSAAFSARVGEQLETIREAIDRDDAVALQTSAHQLKGAALNLGLPQVAATAAELEDLGLAGRTDGADPLFAVLYDAVDRAVAALAARHDDEARQLGAVIGGAYERPRIVEELEMALGELQIEWVAVPDTSPAIGKSLAECGLRAKTGVTVIAILREPEPISGAQPEDVIQKGDRLVAVGKAGQFAEFRRLLDQGPF